MPPAPGSVCSAILVAAGLAFAPAAAAEVVLYESGPTISAMTGPQPGGVPGLVAADDLYQVAGEPALPADRVMQRITGAELVGRSAWSMERLLYRHIVASDARLVIIDELGPAFRGSAGSRLATAMDLLRSRRTSKVKGDLSRRVHVYVQLAGADPTRKDYSGVRRVIAHAGGVWIKAFAGTGAAWSEDQWRTLPPLVAGFASAWGGSGRVHLAFGPGDQARAWDLARGAASCDVLLNGPGTYAVGADAPAFVAEVRRLFVEPGARPLDCAAPDEVPEAIGRALLSAYAAEATGSELAPAPASPPLPAGEPAQLAITLTADPLGLAAAFGIPPEEMWARAGFRVQVTGAGTTADAPIEGDGSARLLIRPTLAGSLRATLVVRGASLLALLGPDVRLVPTLRRIGGDPALLDRVTADPAGWSLAVPVQPAGTAPGSPVAEVIAAP